MNLPDTWIQIMLQDGEYACVEHSEDLLKELRAITDSLSGGAITLELIDSSPLRLRRNFIVGYFVSTPETRERSRRFEAMMKAEDGWQEP
jgi:hypothetical protein